jgi:hypothetical protein
MVRSNRPWRLAMRLYAALVAAFAVAAYGLISFDVWRISAAMSTWRLALTGFTAIAVTVTALIVVHGLWERAPDSRVRDQAILFNLATAATITGGIVALYAVFFIALLAVSALIAVPSLLAAELHEAVGATTYCRHAWFMASIATLGGALGTVLESDDAVREAAYASSRSRANS